MIQDTEKKIKKRLDSISFSYKRVFDMNNKDVEIVLKDLARFCRAHESTFNADQRLHAALEGRREVWLKIQEYLNLQVDEIYAFHKAKQIGKGG